MAFVSCVAFLVKPMLEIFFSEQSFFFRSNRRGWKKGWGRIGVHAKTFFRRIRIHAKTFFGRIRVHAKTFFDSFEEDENIFRMEKGLFRSGKTCVCGHFISGKIIFPKSLHFRFIRANILSRSPPVGKTSGRTDIFRVEGGMDHEKKSHLDSFWSALFLESHFCGWSRLRHGCKRLSSFPKSTLFPMTREGSFLMLLSNHANCGILTTIE